MTKLRNLFLFIFEHQNTRTNVQGNKTNNNQTTQLPKKRGIFSIWVYSFLCLHDVFLKFKKSFLSSWNHLLFIIKHFYYRKKCMLHQSTQFNHITLAQNREHFDALLYLGFRSELSNQVFISQNNADKLWSAYHDVYN